MLKVNKHLIAGFCSSNDKLEASSQVKHENTDGIMNLAGRNPKSIGIHLLLLSIISSRHSHTNCMEIKGWISYYQFPWALGPNLFVIGASLPWKRCISFIRLQIKRRFRYFLVWNWPIDWNLNNGHCSSFVNWADFFFKGIHNAE